MDNQYMYLMSQVNTKYNSISKTVIIIMKILIYFFAYEPQLIVPFCNIFLAYFCFNTELSKAIVITDYGSRREEFEFIPKVEMMTSLAGHPGHVHGSVNNY